MRVRQRLPSKKENAQSAIFLFCMKRQSRINAAGRRFPPSARTEEFSFESRTNRGDRPCIKQRETVGVSAALKGKHSSLCTSSRHRQADRDCAQVFYFNDTPRRAHSPAPLVFVPQSYPL